MNNETELNVKSYIDELVQRYPVLESCKEDIFKAYEALKNCYLNSGKLLVAGNGGSASDSEHIVGELMKSFKLKRRVSEDLVERLCTVDSDNGEAIANLLEPGLPAISLVSQTSLMTAYINDVGAKGVFAQQVLGYGEKSDVFLGISTSGNSDNIVTAAIVARALGLSVVSLTGQGGGRLQQYSDICISVPEKETYKVQELHFPIYHCLCLMLEEYFFGD